MSALARLALLLVVVLVSLSAYLRLAHSGIGCDGWPECYARIGAPAAASVAPADAAYERIAVAGRQPLAWATPLHRLVASVLGVVTLLLVGASLRRRRQRGLALLALGLVLFLAVLGLRSGGLHSPGVVMGNLGGGFALLGVLGWIVFGIRADAGATLVDAADADGQLRLLTTAAVVVLAAQILLGGLTSANFAATACTSLPDCHGRWLPDAEIVTALDLGREHTVDADGRVVGGAERVAVHLAHRWGALLVLGTVLAVVAGALGRGRRTAAAALFALVGVEAAVGAGAVSIGLPIALAVAHNALAGLLLLTLLHLRATLAAP
jgi:cytochrome c oxidase assembly protein subunit 15